ncbi:type I-E CRISPR-associated protein Cse2/CasB [Limosilactobacillus difficilis]|uniref:type I-E CRISPR-associated protein Cse2/CasB n=1 Tax=Limosilactobacillus difficilis TaxID=2991838 RepID=UPI0024BBDD07|nr:type I-E CRISPR-associated protein Cse2/CasB [Limosilactobacillus difficilis]
MQEKNHIKKVTSRIIHELWQDGNTDKAVLAALRNSNSILSQPDIQFWPLLFQQKLEEKDLSRNGVPTNQEQAIFAALHCYAMYQQGNDSLVYKPANKNEHQLFNILSHLRRDERLRDGLDRRVQNVLGNTNPSSMINGIYRLISILKANSNREPVDFGQLGQDLYYLQLGHRSLRQVSLKWGQQYYQVTEDSNN